MGFWNSNGLLNKGAKTVSDHKNCQTLNIAVFQDQRMKSKAWKDTKPSGYYQRMWWKIVKIESDSFAKYCCRVLKNLKRFTKKKKD